MNVLYSIILVAAFPLCYTAAIDLLAGCPTAAAVYAVGIIVVVQTGGQLSAAEFPERLAPGVFDLIGASHQLMHVAMWVGHVLQYLFVWEMHSRRGLASVERGTAQVMCDTVTSLRFVSVS